MDVQYSKAGGERKAPDVTPEMAAAGARALKNFSEDATTYTDGAVAIYLAMELARRSVSEISLGEC